MKVVFVFALLFSISSARVLHQQLFVETSTGSGDSFASGSASVSISYAEPQEEASLAETSSRSANGEVDIYLLADTSSNMARALRAITDDAGDFVRDLFGVASNVRVGVGEYKAPNAAAPYKNLYSIGANQTDAVNAIKSGWSASGRGTPRAQLYALRTVAVASATGFRENSQKIVVWLGNAPGADPALGVSESSAATALQNNDIQVAATNVGGLDNSGQASRITEATNGSLQRFTLGTGPVTSESVASDGGRATASASGPGSVAATRATNGELVSTASSGTATLPEAIVRSVEALVS